MSSQYIIPQASLTPLQCFSTASALWPSKTLELLRACHSIDLLEFQHESKTHLLKFPRLLQGGFFLCYRTGRENRKLLLFHFSEKNYITAQTQFLIIYATAQSAYSQQLLKLRMGPFSPQNYHVISYCWVRTQSWISNFCASVHSPCCSNCAHAYVQAMQGPLCVPTYRWTQMIVQPF